MLKRNAGKNINREPGGREQEHKDAITSMQPSLQEKENPAQYYTMHHHTVCLVPTSVNMY